MKELLKRIYLAKISKLAQRYCHKSVTTPLADQVIKIYEPLYFYSLFLNKYLALFHCHSPKGIPPVGTRACLVLIWRIFVPLDSILFLIFSTIRSSSYNSKLSNSASISLDTSSWVGPKPPVTITMSDLSIDSAKTFFITSPSGTEICLLIDKPIDDNR